MPTYYNITYTYVILPITVNKDRYMFYDFVLLKFFDRWINVEARYFTLNIFSLISISNLKLYFQCSLVYHNYNNY